MSDRELVISPTFRGLAEGDLVWLLSREENPDAATQQECELTIRDIKDAIRKKRDN